MPGLELRQSWVQYPTYEVGCSQSSNRTKHLWNFGYFEFKIPCLDAARPWASTAQLKTKPGYFLGTPTALRSRTCLPESLILELVWFLLSQATRPDEHQVKYPTRVSFAWFGVSSRGRRAHSPTLFLRTTTSKRKIGNTWFPQPQERTSCFPEIIVDTIMSRIDSVHTFQCRIFFQGAHIFNDMGQVWQLLAIPTPLCWVVHQAVVLPQVVQ